MRSESEDSNYLYWSSTPPPDQIYISVTTLRRFINQHQRHPPTNKSSVSRPTRETNQWELSVQNCERQQPTRVWSLIFQHFQWENTRLKKVLTFPEIMNTSTSLESRLLTCLSPIYTPVERNIFKDWWYLSSAEVKLERQCVIWLARSLLQDE